MLSGKKKTETNSEDFMCIKNSCKTTSLIMKPIHNVSKKRTYKEAEKNKPKIT